ncbi:YgaP family membrane protein [Flavobacterium sp.]|uniref:YgaP family membrane protein n=1 Tax=Flavobacterium sp. TaxID=239 RepID=UPI003B9B2A7F
MKANLSSGSQWRRSILAAALILCAYFNIADNFSVQIVLYIASIYLILTAVFKVCLIYKVFGVNASKQRRSGSGMY